ncbi:phosphate ABC transporter substrate-binding protein PstS family protein [Catellicoccus marimammalium]|uniref:Phosphate-binding protein n=1 Tax=Catellicoccus marimammalium M35/04/3 TaxID=1234409 RepID=K8ZCA9_9ENTE|nr:Phosphate ABC transporter, periplasmic phosphate-binding protein PstS [Catellicoccus marimammalium M35/04/3]
MKKLARFGVACSLLGMLFLSGCGNKGEEINIVGSTALQPLAEVAGEEFSSKHPGKFVNVQGGGSGTGLSQVQAGAVQIGNSDLFAEDKKGINAKELVDHKVCVVGIAPIVNKKVGVKDVSLAQLRGIFSGKYTNWKQLGGKDQEIVLLNRAQGSGTRFTFEKWVMKGEKMVRAQEQDSNGMVRQIVADTPGAISYLAFPYIRDDVETLDIDHVAPTDKNVADNKWPIWDYEHMYTKGKPTGLTKEYLDFVQSKPVQENLIPKLGYVPMTKMTVERNAKGDITKRQ